jgi:hypothetical protein
MRERFDQAQSLSTAFTWALWIFVSLLLVVPASMGFADIDSGNLVLPCLIATAGMVGVLIASSRLANRSSTLWMVVAVVLVLLSTFVRMLFVGLVQFSGKDFGAEFFMHLEPESARVAWEQYPAGFIAFGVCMVALVTAFAFASRRAWKPQRKAAAILALSGMTMILGAHAGLPEWRLGHAVFEWYSPWKLHIPTIQMAAWRKSPLITAEVVADQELQAQPAAAPRNLILLYIEAGGVAIAPAKRYPGLMPRLEQLIAEHSLVDHLHASSYVTIEGLVNTMCGTLYPFERGSSTMAGFDGMLENMPCLSDVLSAAGYQQTYLGGSDTIFAGKGRFLRAHGYDKVMGSAEWAKRGINPPVGYWGVSDSDLFDQSFAELDRLKRSGHPFNLTLLTIGSHLPGFLYAECQPYGDGHERFLNAVHCTDQLVGRWLQRLQAEGWLDASTVVVITGDHQVFPNPEMKRLFGEEAVSDYRLPFVVLGQDLPRPLASDGAGYDTAPTILDLLGIETNVRFALGRSLIRDIRTLNQFFSRFGDTLGERPYFPADNYNCASSTALRIPGEAPLSRCERDELSSILVAQATRYSAPAPQMRCNSAVPLHVMVPATIGEPLQVSLSGSDQSERFVWHDRPSDPSKPGLYILSLDRVGKVVERDFTPAAEVGNMQPLIPSTEDVAAMLVMWRPDASPAPLPEWLRHWGVDTVGGSWTFPLSGQTAWTANAHAALGQTIDLDKAQCTTLLPDAMRSGHRQAL